MYTTDSYYTDEDSSLVAGRRIAVFGADGFVGRHMCQYIEDNRGSVCKYTRVQWDLSYPFIGNAPKALRNCEAAINCAGVNGGILYNRDHPASIFDENLMIGLNVMRACSYCDFPLLTILTSCGYPEDLSGEPLEEETFLKGEPNQMARAQGYAKRALLLASNFYNSQMKTNFKCVIPCTLFGPGDNFDPRTSKVVGSMIAKFHAAQQAGAKEVTLLGRPDTLREFCYIDDLPPMLMRVCLNYGTNGKELLPLNLATGRETTMEHLAELICAAMKYKPKLCWGKSATAGQSRKILSDIHMKEFLGSHRRVHLSTGLAKTIEFYKEASAPCKS